MSISNKKVGMDFIKQVPEQVGFGILDLDLTYIKPPEGPEKKASFHAGYRSKNGDKVYEIELDGESCRIEEYFEGKAVEWTRHKTIQAAFNQKFITFFRGRHPRFLSMIDRIKNGRNVFIHNPGLSSRKIVAFPAGFIFILRFPVVGDHRHHRIENELRNKDNPMQFMGMYDGVVITLNDTDELGFENRPIALFETTLLDVEEAVYFCFEHDLICESQLEMRLHVMGIPDAAPGSFNVYVGDGKRILAYSVLLKRQGDISVEQAAKLMRQARIEYRGNKK